MKTDLWLIALGALLLCTGLYRRFPLKLDEKILIFLVPVSVMLIAAIALIILTHNQKILPATGEDFLKITSSYIPILVMLFMSMAIAGRLVTIYQVQVEIFLKNYGVIGAFFAAVISPSSAMASKIVNYLWANPALRVTLVTFVMVSPLLSVSVTLIRMMGMDKIIILKVYGMSFVSALAMIPFVKYVLAPMFRL
jgi:hypothetical protein